MESALIDISNAQQCTEFIGTFSSQFSVLIYLKMIGSQKRTLPYANLSPVAFDSHFPPDVSKWEVTKSIMKSQFVFLRFKWLGLLKRIKLIYIGKDVQTNLDSKFQADSLTHGEQPVLVLRERDVGFFSLFLQVLNTMLSVEEEELDCSVTVEFGKGQSYYDGSNTWLDFFEPLSNQKITPTAKQLERIEENYEIRFSQSSYWDDKGFIYKTEPGVYWTGSYYPKFTPQSPTVYISHKTAPDMSERIRAAKVIEKYFILNQETKEELSKFFERNKIEGFVIGVQFRGTDARRDWRRAIPSYEVFIEAIKDQIKERTDHPIIVAASDEQAFVDTLRSHFQNVKSYETLRHESGDPLDGAGPQGSLMPNFVTNNKNAALKGAVMDYLIISKSDVLIHNLGSLSNAALLTNTHTKSILIGRNIS